MERLKVLCVVMAVLMCAGSSLAAVSTYTLGGDWMDAANWQGGDIANSPDDDVYTQNTNWVNYAVLNEGDTTACRNIYLSLYDFQSPGFVEINGTLNSSLHLLYGNWGYVATEPNGEGSRFNIGATGVVNFAGRLGIAAGIIARETDIQQINVAGELNIGGNAASNTDTPVVISLFGDGSMSVAGTISAGTGLTFDFADAGTLECATADFDALMLAGDITSTGTVGMLTDNGDGTAVYGIVPEPATLALLGLGALVLRRKK